MPVPSYKCLVCAACFVAPSVPRKLITLRTSRWPTTSRLGYPVTPVPFPAQKCTVTGNAPSVEAQNQRFGYAPFRTPNLIRLRTEKPHSARLIVRA